MEKGPKRLGIVQVGRNQTAISSDPASRLSDSKTDLGVLIRLEFLVEATYAIKPIAAHSEIR